ncbi:MAG: hypothetical protein SVR94_03840 [Pseudomonadota bacterium]|nr:hypothetical protein [Pseudomonadota bacterium]
MARRKKTAATIEKAQQRLAALTAIDIQLDLGNDPTLAAYKTVIGQVQTALDNYNAW